MKVEIIKDGVLQPMELFIALFYIGFLVFCVVLTYTVGDYLLTQFPDVKDGLSKPASIGVVLLLWVMIVLKPNKGNN